ncbi:LOW QUALITY PROTEIN: hypothetical protein T265_13817 [Opisthorchis viverrini]|uniref:RNA-binding protein EIF1AD n=1 Tax=Opisthorchis viverrini TaxID=6198 RepID=A0A074ZNH9_OPIVI|nr:LOW QUALITY PROTEIN: hypothetical protein T265_13817 [Opisthorchis viverrini]KER27332.1 LOW QUALITY PROTEIN: hypothetical protein T265_13817 [Opisthorchis viverrini]
MEQAQKAGNARGLLPLICATGPRKPPVSETIKHQDGTTVSNKEERLDRWTEYFEQQLSTHLEPTGEVELWTVNVESPTASEVYECKCSLRHHRAPGPDDLPPALFKDGGEVLSQCLSDLFACIWETESVPDNWGESVIMPVFKKGARSDCGNHRGLDRGRNETVGVNCASSPYGGSRNTDSRAASGIPACVGQIFTLRQVLEQHHTYKRPTILVFLDFRGAFYSVDRSSQTSGRVKVYGELSKSFRTQSGVRQGCPLSPFLFNFVVDEIMRRTLEGLQNPDVQIACEENLADREYADDIVRREGKGAVLWYAPTKFKVMLVDLQSLNTPLTIQGEVLEVAERFTYLGSCISSDCSVTDEVNARIYKARTAFANLRRLWRQNGLFLNLKGRVYQATVRAVLLYGCETWPIRAADLRCLQVFDNRCLRTIACVGCCRRIRNEAVRKRVFGCVTGTSIEECVQHQKLRWLGHVLRMPNHRLPKSVLFSMPNSEWRKQRGGQPLTWQRSMKEITKHLGAVGATRPPGWGPRDPHCAWLDTLQDMAANRCQWRSCCQFLSRLPELSNKSWLYGSEVSVLNTDVMLSMVMMMMMTCVISTHYHFGEEFGISHPFTIPMYPSSIPRRKKVERELFDTLYSVGPGEFICKLLKSQGNYLFTAEDERGEQLLLSIPDRLRNAFYFSSGDYVLCAPLENKKVRGEIRTVLYEKQITHLIGLNFWPKNFPTISSRKTQNQDEPYLPEDMLPSSDSSYDEEESDSIKEEPGSNSS